MEHFVRPDEHWTIQPFIRLMADVPSRTRDLSVKAGLNISQLSRRSVPKNESRRCDVERAKPRRRTMVLWRWSLAVVIHLLQHTWSKYCAIYSVYARDRRVLRVVLRVQKDGTEQLGVSGARDMSTNFDWQRLLAWASSHLLLISLNEYLLISL